MGLVGLGVSLGLVWVAFWFGSVWFGWVGLPCGCFIITKTLKAKSADDNVAADAADYEDDDDDDGDVAVVVCRTTKFLLKFSTDLLLLLCVLVSFSVLQLF